MFQLKATFWNTCFLRLISLGVAIFPSFEISLVSDMFHFNLVLGQQFFFSLKISVDGALFLCT